MTPSPMPADEAVLIKKALRGERDAFCQLIHPYERMVYATAITVLRNPADAEEVAQEAILKAFAGLANFRGESKFSTWLLQITYNEAKIRLRKARRYVHESIEKKATSTKSGEFWPKDFADWRPIPSEVLEEEEVRELVHEAINSLEPMYREVLVLRDVELLSIKETMTILGISEGSVKTRLRRARLQLRDALAPGIDGCWIRRQPYRKVRAW